MTGNRPAISATQRGQPDQFGAALGRPNRPTLACRLAAMCAGIEKAACGWQRGEPRSWLTGREAGRYSGTILNRPQQALSFLGEPLTAVPTGPDRPAASCSAPPLGPAQDS